MSDLLQERRQHAWDHLINSLNEGNIVFEEAEIEEVTCDMGLGGRKKAEFYTVGHFIYKPSNGQCHKTTYVVKDA